MLSVQKKIYIQTGGRGEKHPSFPGEGDAPELKGRNISAFTTSCCPNHTRMPGERRLELIRHQFGDNEEFDFLQCKEGFPANLKCSALNLNDNFKRIS